MRKRCITNRLFVVFGCSLIFVMIISMTSCNTSSNEKTTSVVNTAVPTELPSPTPKTLGFSIDRDKIDFVAIHISSYPENGFHGNGARIYDKEGIDAAIQILNSMEGYPKDKSYKYYGGDSPNAMVNFFDKKYDVIEVVNICFDQKLNEFVCRCQGRIYQIDPSEIDKLYEICEKYKKDNLD